MHQNVLDCLRVDGEQGRDLKTKEGSERTYIEWKINSTYVEKPVDLDVRTILVDPLPVKGLIRGRELVEVAK